MAPGDQETLNPNVEDVRKGRVWPRITVLSGSAHFAPYWKRINALRDLGPSINVIAFERTWNPGPRLECKYQLLGRIPIRGYVQRLWPFLKSLPIIRAAANKTDVLYVFGFDMMLLTSMALVGIKRRPRTMYEVQDIRNILVRSGPIGWIMRTLDRIMVRRADLLVVSSAAYVIRYFEGILGLRGIRNTLLENKLDKTRTPPPEETVSGRPGHLRIGYFGSLRCPESWEVLKRLVREAPDRVQIYVRGVPNTLRNFHEDVEATPNITYDGPYANPQELPDVYRHVDIVWDAGFNSKLSGGWSRTCRFYEACFYGKPLIAQTDTEDGNAVSDLGIGLCVNVLDIAQSVEQVLGINEASLARWHERLAALSPAVYVYTDDHSQLLDTIERLVKPGDRH